MSTIDLLLRLAMSGIFAWWAIRVFRRGYSPEMPDISRRERPVYFWFLITLFSSVAVLNAIQAIQGY